MKIGDKVRVGFDHMFIYPTMISDDNCHSEVGSIVGIDVNPHTIYPIIVELTTHAMPDAYRYGSCYNVSFRECELVLCN